jgi:hypothetical protein
MKYITTHRINQLKNEHRVPRSEKFYYQGNINTLNKDYAISLTFDELKDYSTAHNYINDFIYSGIKTLNLDNGQYNKLVLRDFQYKILADLKGNFTIHHTARQMGLDLILRIKILHDVLFHGKKYMLNKESSGINLLTKCFEQYIILPTHFKKGIVSKTTSAIHFNNGGFITLYDKTLIKDITHFVFNDPIKEKNKKILIDNFEILKDCKIHIKTSTTKPKWIKELVDYSKNKNTLSKYKDYDFDLYEYAWNLVPNRGLDWVNSLIRTLGSKEAFEDKYNLGIKLDM